MAKNGCGTLKNKDKKLFVVEYYVFVYWNVLEVALSIENYVCKRSINIPISFFKLPSRNHFLSPEWFMTWLMGL